MSVPIARAAIRALQLPPFDPLNRRAAQLRADGHTVIALGQAIPDFAPPAAALEAARSALDRAETHRYVTDPGLPSLRDALAERLSADTTAAAVDREEIIITAGANHAFTLALTTLVDAGDEVILLSPYFTNHAMAVRAHGAIVVEAPIADTRTYSVSWEDIAPHLTARTRAVVLCNPSNPTGAPLTPDAGAHIVAEASRRGILVISDETYMHFVYDRPHWSLAAVPGWRTQVVVIGTFSKSFGMMGWRVGFLLADAAVCEQAIKVQDEMIICAPVMSQIAAEAAVRVSWTHAAGFHDEFRARRQILATALEGTPGIDWTPTAGGMFAFARIADCRDSMRFSLDLLEHAHVVTIPGVVFGAAGEGCVRLSYGYAAQDELREAMARIRAFLAG